MLTSTQFYSNSIGLPFANVCYFYNLILDLLVSFEKLSIFVKRLENINKNYFSWPHLVSIAAFLVCLIVDFPFFFFYVPTERTAWLSQNVSFDFWLYQMSDFTKSNVGQATLYIQHAVRDLIPIIILVTMNIMLVVQLKRYVNKKKAFTKNNTKIATSILENTKLATSNMVGSSAILTSKAASSSNKASKATISTSLMVISICIQSAIKSCVMLASITYHSIQTDVLAKVLVELSNYVIYTCTLTNFFIIYSFDKNINEFFKKKLFKNRVKSFKV